MQVQESELKELNLAVLCGDLYRRQEVIDQFKRLENTHLRVVQLSSFTELASANLADVTDFCVDATGGLTEREIEMLVDLVGAQRTTFFRGSDLDSVKSHFVCLLGLGY